jgi:hypothetical protein
MSGASFRIMEGKISAGAAGFSAWTSKLIQVTAGQIHTKGLDGLEPNEGVVAYPLGEDGTYF